jgi:hypothetical protein
LAVLGTSSVLSWISVLGFGTLLGVGVKYGLDQLNEKRRRREERDALLRLISIEVAHNTSKLLFLLIHDPLDLVSEEEIDGLKMDTWESARISLAQFVASELSQADFDFIAGYYLRLQHLIAYVSSPRTQRQRDHEQAAPLLRRILKKQLEELEAARKNADTVIKKYIVPTDIRRPAPEE